MKIPSATYRLQFHSAFTFQDAQRILNYLHRLGISDVYASPVFKAVKGSTHGYDVTDPNALNPELGTEADYQSLMRDKERLGMGWLQDIVPNHTAFSADNAMLMDVLRQREKSPYYYFFDIEWNDLDPALNGKVLVPVLGTSLDEALKAGEIQVKADNDQLTLAYYDHRLPLNGESVHWLTSQVRQVDALDDFHKGDAGIMRMKALLAQQYYVLDCWKNTKDHINYRRFFYINQLIAMCVEDADVMAATHRLIFEQVRRRHWTGLRIDHIDGLYAPTGYLRRLRQACPDAYIVAEKILEQDEPLCDDWRIEGTTGYDFCAQVNALFCDRANRTVFLDHYQAFIGERVEYETLRYDKKKLILTAYMVVELDKLAVQACGLLGATVKEKDVKRALCAIIAAFGVYRSYFDGRTHRRCDRQYIRQAVQTAKQFEPAQSESIALIETLLLAEKGSSEDISDFIRRFEQLTGPVMAKGFEDTLLYHYIPLASQNEVGGFPHAFGVEAEAFWAFVRDRQLRWPHAMNATATHDTKRGEDVRARLNVLSEMPAQWFDKVSAWSRMNEPFKRLRDGALIPDRNDEYLIYQTLVGVMPFEDAPSEDFCERLKAYTVKAMRESKRHTKWIAPDKDYEQSAEAFISRVLSEDNAAFWRDFDPFRRRIAEYGILNSLSQTLLKLTLPGVCDFYQGTELWDLSLVDPDNRRPVDYAQRGDRLETIIRGGDANRPDLLKSLIESRTEGTIKLYLIYTLLQQRQRHPDVFERGAFEPLGVEGRHCRSLLAFARHCEGMYTVTLVPRFITALVEPPEMPLGNAVWDDTRIVLPKGFAHHWDNVLTGATLTTDGTLTAAQSLTDFPVAFLVSRPR